MRNLNDITVWTATITPMNDDGSIDYDSFKNTLKTQSNTGNGVLILGSTGEALNIDHDEHAKIVNFACQQNLDVPIMVGVGGSNQQAQIDWIKHLNTKEIDAILMAVPLYSKPGTHGQYEWFKALMDASENPCMVYNIPSRTGMPLSHEALKMISKHPNFWAVKESSASVEEFKKYCQDAPNAHMLSGDDIMLNDFAALGAKGVVSVAANVWPEATAEYARQCLNQSLEEVEEWKSWSKALFAASNPVPTKVLMAEKEMISTPTVHPPLSLDDLKDKSVVTDASQAVSEWLTNQN